VVLELKLQIAYTIATEATFKKAIEVVIDHMELWQYHRENLYKPEYYTPAYI
jgi:hypothetical protein